MYRRDVGLGEQMLDRRLEIGLVENHGVVVVVHRVVGAIGSQHTRAGSQLFGEPPSRRIAVAARSVDIDRPYLSPHRREIERGVGDQRDLLTRPGEAQATTQRFTLAGGGEWAQVVAMTISATTANVVEMSGVDGTHK